MKKILLALPLLAATFFAYTQNVGIGTVSPLFKLDVRNGSINTDSVYRIGSNTVLAVPGVDNLFVGIDAGRTNTGSENTFIGNVAGYSNTTGFSNSFFGRAAGINNTSGNYNSFLGVTAGSSNNTGTYNSFFGWSAGNLNTSGNDNSFFGLASGYSNTTGFNNSFFGRDAGFANTNGSANAFFGGSAGYSNTIGSYNAFFGDDAGFNNTTGGSNSFFGPAAGHFNNIGLSNSFFGQSSGFTNTTGSNNTAVGTNSLNANGTGSLNTALGFKANVNSSGLTNVTALGANARVDCSNCMVLGSINGINEATSGVNVGIGTTTPGFPLNFSNLVGDKISLFGTTANHYGFGIQNNLLQIHASGVGEDIAFGYGSSAALTETMRIKGNGNVGIGITTPNAPLAFTNTTGPKISLYEGSANSQYGFAVQSGQLQLYTDALAAKISFGYYTSGLYTERMYLTNNTGILTVAGTNYPSDARYKKEIARLQNPLEKIMAINGVEYFMRTDEFPLKQFDDKLQVGLIAQEVEKILPQVVQTGEDGFKAIDYAKIVPLLVEGIKEQQKQIDELRKTVEKLRKY